jgi:predicted TIM-barrel fold metal-dependent hydrolase
MMMTSAIPPLLSSDGHLEVRPERWSPFLPADYRSRAPRTIKLPDGSDAIAVEGQPPQRATFIDLRAGRTNEDWQPFGITVEDTAGVGPPEQRLREQDQDGLGAEVLFPNMLLGPRLWRTIADDGLYRACVRAYNDWLGQEYCAASRDRLIGLGVIPWTNLQDALAELRYCRDLGLKGVNLGVFPSGKVFPTPEDDAFWAEALAMNMPVAVHVAFDRTGPRAAQPTYEYPGVGPEMLQKIGPRKFVDWVALPFLGAAPALSLSQLAISGLFDRFPKLRIFFAETRLGWVPFWMEAADYWFERHRHWAKRLLNVAPPQRLPSEYVRDHILFSIQPVERVAIELRAHFGPDSVMFATDFPHIESDWPNTRPIAEKLFANVPPTEAFKIGAGNMLSFFRLENTTMAKAVAVQSA